MKARNKLIIKFSDDSAALTTPGYHNIKYNLLSNNTNMNKLMRNNQIM